MGRHPPRTRRRLIGWIPFVFVAVVLAIPLLTAALQPRSVTATVLAIRTVPSQVATVQWVDADGATITEDVVVPIGYRVGDQIQIVPGDEATPTRAGGRFVVSAPVIAVLALAAFLLGLVVDLSRRGFGYVRGTGHAGQTEPDELAETRGFYWRT